MIQIIRKLIWDLSAKTKPFPGKERFVAFISRPTEFNQTSINRDGARFRVYGHDINEFTLAIRKNHSPILSEILGREITQSNAKVFWDIGANIGAISLPLLKKFNGLRVFLFEPSAGVAGSLIRNLQENPDLYERASIINAALSNTNGLVDFFVSNEDFNSGVAGLGKSANREKFSVKVQSYAGDYLITTDCCLPPDLIKIDVEGYEYEVFKGLEETLLKSHPTIIFEHSQYRFIERKQSKDQVTSYLESLGYSIHHQITNAPIKEDDLHVDGDFIARKI